MEAWRVEEVKWRFRESDWALMKGNPGQRDYHAVLMPSKEEAEICRDALNARQTTT